MSFDLKGDVKDLFRSIALVNGLEVDVDPSINRIVTVHINDIPWNLALDVVLRTTGLCSELNGRVLRIAAANPALGQDRVLAGTVTIEGKITEPSSLHFFGWRNVCKLDVPVTSKLPFD